MKNAKQRMKDLRICLGKCILLVVLGWMCCQSVGAQVRMAVVISPQLNESLGVRAGVDVDIPMGRFTSFVPGLYYSMRHRNSHESKEYTASGGGYLHAVYDYRDRAHLLSIPLRMSVCLAGKAEERFAVQLLAGPYVAYGIGGTSQIDKQVNGVKEGCREVGAFAAGGRYRYRWDYGLHSAIHATFHRHYSVGFFTEIGLRKIYQPVSAIDDFLGDLLFVSKINLALGLTLGYRF